MIDFEKGLNEIDECISTIKQVCCMNFKYELYPSYKDFKIKIKFIFNEYNQFYVKVSLDEPKERKIYIIFNYIILIIKDHMESYINEYKRFNKSI